MLKPNFSKFIPQTGSMLISMKFSFLSVVLLSVLCGACKPVGKSPDVEALNDGRQKAGGDFLLVPGERIGPLYGEHSLENDLVQTFGAQNVKRQDIYLGEGNAAPGFVIFGDTRNAVEVHYDTSIVKDRPALLRISEEGTDWESKHGITVGTTLEELVRINGKPITFWGFGWDYGGAVSNWNGGKIDSRLMIVLDDTRRNTPESLLGEREISSVSPEIDVKKIVVKVINVRL
jgi:hypothetical protein